jgi:hypothetical protein
MGKWWGKLSGLGLALRDGFSFPPTTVVVFLLPLLRPVFIAVCEISFAGRHHLNLPEPVLHGEQSK